MLRPALSMWITLFAVALASAAAVPEKGLQELALHHLSLAEDAVREMSDPAQKAYALIELSTLYAAAGDLNSATDIASRLGKTDRLRATRGIVRALAKRGELDAAVATARQTKDDRARADQLADIVVVLSKDDVAGARTLLSEVPEPQRSRAMAAVAEQQALTGDLEGAATTAEAVRNADARAEAQLYIATAQAVRDHADLSALAQRLRLPASELPLGELVKGRLRADDVAGAVRTVALAPEPLQKSLCNIELADYFAGHNRAPDALKILKDAASETARIGGNQAVYMKLTRYLSIAAVQIKAGDMPDAAGTLALAKAEAQALEASLLEASGLRLKLVSGFARVGQLQDARALATLPDGQMLPAGRAILAKAYADQGADAQAEELLRDADPNTEFQIRSAIAHSLLEDPMSAQP